MKKPLLLLLALGFTTFGYADEWLTNYDQALSKAKAEHKRLLINFTGSDWCAGCIKMDRDVFALREFTDYAKKNLVLFKADLPVHKELPAAEKEQNLKLVDDFHIEGYPAFVVLNPDGTKAEQFDYVEGGPKEFIAVLNNNGKPPAGSPSSSISTSQVIVSTVAAAGIVAAIFFLLRLTGWFAIFQPSHRRKGG